MSTLRKEVVEVLALEGGRDPDEIRDGDELRDIGLGDSLDLVEAAVELEEVFDLDIPDEIIEAWRTVEDVVSYFEATLR